MSDPVSEGLGKGNPVGDAIRWVSGLGEKVFGRGSSSAPQPTNPDMSRIETSRWAADQFNQSPERGGRRIEVMGDEPGGQRQIRIVDNNGQAFIARGTVSKTGQFTMISMRHDNGKPNETWVEVGNNVVIDFAGTSSEVRKGIANQIDKAVSQMRSRAPAKKGTNVGQLIEGERATLVAAGMERSVEANEVSPPSVPTLGGGRGLA